jgi:hypothetical protein
LQLLHKPLVDCIQHLLIQWHTAAASAAAAAVSLQICSHIISVTDRLTPYLLGLDVPAVVLLMAQRLVASAAAAAVPATNGLRFAAAPKPRALEEGRLAIGMALAHVAQRMGHAHVSRRGWFGSQQVGGCASRLVLLAMLLCASSSLGEAWTACLEPKACGCCAAHQLRVSVGLAGARHSSLHAFHGAMCTCSNMQHRHCSAHV